MVVGWRVPVCWVGIVVVVAELVDSSCAVYGS